MQGTEDQFKVQKISAWDERSVPGTGDWCLGQKISARDKRSTLRTFHGVIHELLTCILHTQTRCRSLHECGFATGQKTLENQEWAYRRRAIAGRGPRAAGPLWAVGHGAFGPLCRWAVAGCGPLGRGPAFSKTLYSGRKVQTCVVKSFVSPP